MMGNSTTPEATRSALIPHDQATAELPRRRHSTARPATPADLDGAGAAALTSSSIPE